jgi:hypothetical protein
LRKRKKTENERILNKGRKAQKERRNTNEMRETKNIL